VSQARALCEQAVTDRVCPAVALVATRRGGGELAVRAGAARAETRFDLASLTKVLYTAAAAMLLVDAGRLDLDETLDRLLPEWRPGRRAGARIRHLLHHEAGVPWWRPLYEQVGAPPGAERTRALRGAVRRAALELEVEAAPGSTAVYSDPGFMLLEMALERAADEPLAGLVRRRLWGPLGLDSLRFIDLTRANERTEALATALYAPTERCGWRGRRLLGEVHDDNAHAMGGVAGHAGLFGTAADVHGFGVGLLESLHGEGPVPAAIVERFFRSRGESPTSTRTLGWDTPTAGGSSAGRYVTASAVGHLGFTGTSLWIDPEAEIVTALLTNRVFYGREDSRIRTLRPRVHDAVYETLGATG